MAGAAVFVADFLIKRHFRVSSPEASVPIIKNIFHLTPVFNHGAAFGILQGRTVLLIAVSVVLLVLFFLSFHKEEDFSRFNAVAYGIILGGALCNLYDRVVFGYVVDYLDFRVFPVFNLSDTAITTGIGLLLIKSFFPKPAR